MLPEHLNVPTEDPIEVAVRAIVDRAPPLSDEQADRLSQLLTPPVKSRGAA